MPSFEGVTIDEHCHAESMLSMWFGKDITEGAVNTLSANITCNLLYFPLFVMETAPNSQGRHDHSLLHEFDFNLLHDELTDLKLIFLVPVLYLVCWFPPRFLRYTKLICIINRARTRERSLTSSEHIFKTTLLMPNFIITFHCLRKASP
jgi:hypothetical protein